MTTRRGFFRALALSPMAALTAYDAEASEPAPEPQHFDVDHVQVFVSNNVVHGGGIAINVDSELVRNGVQNSMITYNYVTL